MSDYRLGSSIPRKRYSFAPSNDILSTIDKNIPSSVKRKRLSLLPSNINIGAPRLTGQMAYKRQSSFGLQQSSNTTPRLSIQDAFQQSVQRTSHIPLGLYGNNNNSNKRQTTLINSAATVQQIPVQGSSAGRLYDNSMIAATPLRSSAYYKGRDSRPLRDRTFQSTMQNTLFDFLSTNKFDIEMKHQLSSKTLTNPTQKDFTQMFIFLYHKLDPGYKFEKSIEHEVYSLLKFLEYPYLDSINKSQISAAGGINWPMFLGMLYWLLKLVKESLGLDNIELDNFQDQQQSQQQQNNSMFYDETMNDSVIAKEQNLVDKLFTKYALRSYKDYMSTGGNRFDNQFNEMERQYQSYIKEVNHRSNTLNEETLRLEADVQDLLSKRDNLHSQIETTEALETDVAKFNYYIEVQNQRRQRWPILLEKIKNDIDETKAKIKAAEEEKQQILKDLNARKFSLKDLEKMHRERQEVSIMLNTVSEKQEQLKKTILDRFETLKQMYIDLERLINDYNNSIYNILSSIDLGGSENLPQLTITNFNDDIINNDSNLGLTPDQLIPQLKELKIRYNLNELKKSISKKHEENQETIMMNQENWDDLKLQILTQKDEVESLEEQFNKSRKEYNEKNENFNTEISTKQLKFEERSKEIRMLTFKTDERRKKVQNDYDLTQKQIKKLAQELNQHRETLFLQISECMNYVVTFKTDIMTDLENMNASLIDEYTEQCQKLRIKFA